MVERLQAHHVQKSHRGAVKLRLSRSAAAADLGDELTQLEVGEDAFAVDAANLFDSRTRNRLLISDDGERFVGGRRKLARNLGTQSATHGGCKCRARGEVELVMVT